jgi:stearoyl-CoA desaturase (delta-9 desaturase)
MHDTTTTTPPSASALERRITVFAVVLPFAGFLAALWLLWGGAVTGRDLAILAVAYILVGFGVTIGFHRMLTHRSFEAKPWVRATLAILGSMSVQGAVIHWVADHRRHHAFTDEEGDPHSPHTHEGEGWRAVLTGLWHSHMGWLFEGQRTSARRYAPDLRKDSTIRWVDKLFPVWALLGLLLPALAGFAISGGSLFAAFTAFVWAGLVRVFLLHHATWSVNSICHMYGRRPFAIKDESRDNWLVALVWGGLVRIFVLHHATWSVNSICHMYGSKPFAIEDESRDNWMVAMVSLGEGWHHSHHAFPTSAQHGLNRAQLDPSYAVIRGLEKLGLVWNVKRPSDERVEAKRRAPAGAVAA